MRKFVRQIFRKERQLQTQWTRLDFQETGLNLCFVSFIEFSEVSEEAIVIWWKWHWHLRQKLIWKWFCHILAVWKNHLKLLDILSHLLNVVFSCSVMSDSATLQGLQHARCPYPSLSPGVCLNVDPLSWWYHPTISSSVIPFSSCPQSFPASGSFQMSWLFQSVDQSIGASTSASVLPMNIQDWFPLGLSGLISLQSKGLSGVFSNTTVQKLSVLWCLAFFMVQLSHPYMTTGKTIAMTRQTFVCKVMSLLFNMLSGLVIAFLPRSKCLNFMAAVTICSDFGAQEKQSFTVSSTICHEMMQSDAWCFQVLSEIFYSLLSLSRGSLVPLCFLP